MVAVASSLANPGGCEYNGGAMKAIRLVAFALLALAAGVLAPPHAQTLLPTLDMPSLPTGALSSSAAGGVCVMPWAVDGDETLGSEDYWGLEPTELYALRTSDFATPGTLGALALYGIGAKDYKEAITTPCAGGDRGACDQPGPGVWAGQTLVCAMKPGNIGDITNDALRTRYGKGTDCDALTYDEAFALAGTELCQDRAVFIPTIDAFPPLGSHGLIEILGIGTFYIAGWDRYPPWGNVDVNGDTVPDDAMVWGYFLFDQPPDCSAAAPSVTEIWPPNHKMLGVNILGVTDPEADPVSIVVTGITQDEPVDGLGDADTSPDGAGVGTDTAQVRAERDGTPNVRGDGRVYHIHFEASDGEGGVCSGLVNVGVPHDRRPGDAIVDGGELYDSTVP